MHTVLIATWISYNKYVCIQKNIFKEYNWHPPILWMLKSAPILNGHARKIQMTCDTCGAGP